MLFDTKGEDDIVSRRMEVRVVVLGSGALDNFNTQEQMDNSSVTY